MINTKRVWRLGLLAVCFTWLALPAMKAQYQWLPMAGAPESWRLDDIFFLNPQEGWAINPSYSYLLPPQNGRVLHTQDGGQSWQVQVDTAATFIRSIGFADHLHGWYGNLGMIAQATDTNFMYQTTDGGQSWMPVTNLMGPRPKGVCGISVTSDSTIYGYGRFYGDPTMIKTTDLGASWQSQALDSLASGLVDGWFFGPDTGFVVGSSGQPHKALILSTVDGGASWQVRHQSMRDDETGWKVFFPSRLVGYVAIQSYLEELAPSPPSTTWISKTTDGGLTWTDKVVATNGYYKLEGIGFINDSVGWLGGDCCMPWNFKTTNGGDTWQVDWQFGVATPPYHIYGGYAINRFRKFGDTLMYASGNTIYRLDPVVSASVPQRESGSEVQIWPNPNRHGQLHIAVAGLQEDVVVELYDLQGRAVMDAQRVELAKGLVELPSLPVGLYVYRVRARGRILGHGKLMVEDL